ncbi:MAG: DUF4258 domain-containing protein [Caldilineaceae bacterium]|nr:DUF4258 domain-containing protein [Caldilineaceae bacterium]
MSQPILDAVRAAARKRILYLLHAVNEMNAPDELITPEEVRRVVFDGELIEDYPEDVRGHSCLLLGTGTGGRQVHVVCSPKDEYLSVITVYIPDARRWEDGGRRRRR